MADELLKRVMPNNVEAEQSVIGAMLMDRDAITIASEILTVDDFYQKQYGILFEAMVELYTENVPVDLITLQNRLKEKDVPPEIIVQTAIEKNVRLVGLSALMTTTVESMAETIRQLRKAHDCKVMVGGAVLNPEYAKEIGADFYSKDAMGSVRYAEKLFNGEV